MSRFTVQQQLIRPGISLCLTLSFFITYLRFCSLLFILAHSNNKLASQQTPELSKVQYPCVQYIKCCFIILR